MSFFWRFSRKLLTSIHLKKFNICHIPTEHFNMSKDASRCGQSIARWIKSIRPVHPKIFLKVASPPLRGGFRGGGSHRWLKIAPPSDHYYFAANFASFKISDSEAIKLGVFQNLRHAVAWGMIGTPCFCECNLQLITTSYAQMRSYMRIVLLKTSLQFFTSSLNALLEPRLLQNIEKGGKLLFWGSNRYD